MLRKIFGSLVRNRKGQGLVEYGLIIAGVALICAAAISVFGHKTSDLISAVATVLPGAHFDDNAPMASGRIIETASPTVGAPIALDTTTIVANSTGLVGRLSQNVTGVSSDGFGGLIQEVP